MDLEKAKWITAPADMGQAGPLFTKEFSCETGAAKAVMHVSAVGLYKLFVNGTAYSFGLFNPGFTSYQHRIQYQTYDVTESIRPGKNRLEILAAGGWATANMLLEGDHLFSDKVCVIAELTVCRAGSGAAQNVVTDETWDVSTSRIRYSHLYNGEIIDYSAKSEALGKAVPVDISRLYGETMAAQGSTPLRWKLEAGTAGRATSGLVDKAEMKAKPEDFPIKAPELVPQEGVPVAERERVPAKAFIVTPEGDRVIDFGQNLSGYVEIRVCGKRGDRVKIRHAETLSKDGNFYTKNLRTAKATMEYVLGRDGEQVLKPEFTTQGFRYIAIDEYPGIGEIGEDFPSRFTSVAVYADMKQTGRFSCENVDIQKLYECILWTERSNFMEVPTDCPQRDERHGWLGDAALFCRAAAYNYDVAAFFGKWLKDVALEQEENGAVRSFTPHNDSYDLRFSAAWGDAVVTIPYELYKIYGDREALREQFPCMRRWVDFMHADGPEEYLWTGGNHYGDWLALDGSDPRNPLTDKDFIGSAYFYHSTQQLIACGRVLGEDMSAYETLLGEIRRAFRQRFVKDGLPAADTMTGCILLLQFGLTEPEEEEAVTARLLELLAKFDYTLCTGLLGTAFLLHVLSAHGHAKEAYDLLLQKKYPSWLCMMEHGATTIWERFDTIDDNGIKDVKNASLNHYVYGTIFDWLVEGAAGIRPCFEAPGYEKLIWKPVADPRVGALSWSLETKFGTVQSAWKVLPDGKTEYELTLPDGVTAEVKLPGISGTKTGGRHRYVL
ncbi:MAG: family 78 glycoside hydrolase catalytic domain [Eubacteriales bacterium]|nr:family 78 glycoside hydrolase catalytic domain [Eubacteriales bacterium]